jgi:predicted nucleic acid-binding protein
MCRVLDTNVLVSAVLDPNSVPGHVTRAAFQHEYELVASRRLLGELNNVLARPKISALVSGEEAASFVEAVDHPPLRSGARSWKDASHGL